MRSLLQAMINALLSADADAVVGAEWGEPSPSCTTQRNGYRHRDLDIRVGTVDVAIPELRSGTEGGAGPSERTRTRVVQSPVDNAETL